MKKRWMSLVLTVIMVLSQKHLREYNRKKAPE